MLPGMNQSPEVANLTKSKITKQPEYSPEEKDESDRTIQIGLISIGSRGVWSMEPKWSDSLIMIPGSMLFTVRGHLGQGSKILQT